MLIGIEGGAASGGPRSVRQLLERFQAWHEEKYPEQEVQGLEATIEVLAAFFQPENAELIPGLPRPAPPAGGPWWDLGRLPASLLPGTLLACLELFCPFCVVSANLVEVFHRLALECGLWLRREGLAAAPFWREFDERAERLAGEFARHFALQEALEETVAPLLPSLTDGAVQGRFELVEVEEATIGARGPQNVYTLRLPRAARGAFAPGHHASLVLVRRALGWTPVAASLPMDPDAVEGRLEGLRREAARGDRYGLLRPAGR